MLLLENSKEINFIGISRKRRSALILNLLQNCDQAHRIEPIPPFSAGAPLPWNERIALMP
jgi:hypothetical protein